MVSIGDMPGGDIMAIGLAMNDSGQIVGMSDSGNGFEAYVWDSETGMVALGDLAGGIFQSQGMGLNDVGQIVGRGNADPGSEAVIWNASTGMLPVHLIDKVTDGTATGWIIEEVRDINNKGQIVGWGFNPSGIREAVLLNPVRVRGSGLK